MDRKVIKGKSIVDQLAEAPLSKNNPMHIEIPDNDILTISTQQWMLYFDDSYTQHGSGARIFFVFPQGYTIPKSTN